MTRGNRDWLERANFRPALQDSGDNPFLRDHLPPEDIRPLERASIASFYALPVGLVSMGVFIGPFSWAPPWLALVTGVVCLFLGFRGMSRVEAAWQKALQDFRDS